MTDDNKLESPSHPFSPAFPPGTLLASEGTILSFSVDLRIMFDSCVTRTYLRMYSNVSNVAGVNGLAHDAGRLSDDKERS
jgi:hypothetical protein